MSGRPLLQHGYAVNLQVKQFVAKLRAPSGATFQVFTTGDARYYLFDLLDEHGCSTTIQIPVRKQDLKPEYRRALAKGWGNAV